jgi:stress-induced morphogen
MPVEIRGNADKTLKEIAKVLASYLESSPEAQIVIYRQNSVSIRIRVIDPSFAGQERSERHRRIWDCLDKASAHAQSDITMLVLLTPEETETSFGNMTFDNPTPSRL